MGFQKPNNMHYRNLMDELGKSLLQDEPSSDLVALVGMQRLSENIAAFHRSKDLGVNDPIAAEMNAQIFQNELNAWRTKTSDEVRSLRTSF
jgi:hypothetical protein